MKKLVVLLISVLLCLIIWVTSFFNPVSLIVSGVVSSASSTPVIIIDAGHGGFDGGTSASDGTLEKDINLKIALYLNDYLSSFGYKTILTRESDVSLEKAGLSSLRSKKTSDIYSRMEIMENTDNSIFISIHQNHFSVEKYSGIQVFYSPDFSKESSELAQNIQETVSNTLQPDNKRLIKECGDSVYLVYNAVKPAVLVECGFLSNYIEAEKLKKDDYQKKMAFCIAIGTQNYIISRMNNNGKS